jgi:hypothetical protein
MGEGRFSNGFMLGVIVGGLIVFLWGTKTGKNILKIISEEGLEGLGNLVEEYGLDEALDEESFDDASPSAEASGDRQDSEGQATEAPETESQKPLKRRFFKRR